MPLHGLAERKEEQGKAKGVGGLLLFPGYVFLNQDRHIMDISNVDAKTKSSITFLSSTEQEFRQGINSALEHLSLVYTSNISRMFYKNYRSKYFYKNRSILNVRFF